MPYEERGVWIQGVVAVAAYLVYLSVILGLARETPITEVAYVVPMLWTIGGAIVAGIVLTIIVGIITGIVTRDKIDQKDQRDRDIYRWGEYIGHTLVIAGALVAMLLAMLERDPFWIANVLYLAFVLSAILSTIVKIVAYRRGLPTW